ncbi:pyridoxal phosphate-dependent aminotransferase [Streptomyces sp. NBC_01716]|uniref:pyridoxal phosphate-dependent aminotransferase n=1 Tax=Streptomyces sp. NBC_01716 TaxID=2975917 RepID=UPI002E317C72|nr:pyridoxal phosphate-dependent aminotransferase [Streptomyces sp. NBC_01716]
MNALTDLGRLPALELADWAFRHNPALIPVAGAPVLEMPEHVVDAVRVSASRTHPRETQGALSLRHAIAAMVRERDGVCVDPEHELLVAHGATHALSVCLGSVCSPGDEIIVPAPSYFFDGPIARAGAVPRHVAGTPGEAWALDIAGIEAAVTARTRAILLCNPVNPTGRVLTSAELRAVIRIAGRHGALVIVDESFSHFVYDGAFVPISGFREEYPELVSVQSLTKNYAFASWRVGYLVASAERIRTATRCLEWEAIHVGAVPQAAAEAALTGPRDWIDQAIGQYPAKRSMMVGILRDAGFPVVTPAGGVAAFADFSVTGLRGRELERHLVDLGILALAGDRFHGPANHARMLFGGDFPAIESTGHALMASRTGLRTGH